MRDETFAMPEAWMIALMLLSVSLSGRLGLWERLCSLDSGGLHSTSRPRGWRWKINHGGIVLAGLDE